MTMEASDEVWTLHLARGRRAGRVVNRYDLDRTILVSGLVLVALGLAGIVAGLWVGA